MQAFIAHLQRPLALARTLSLGLALLSTVAVHAEGSASSASSAGSASVGSLSDSIQGSSRSSSGQAATAQGDYRVLDVAMAPGRPDRVRLTLQAVDAREDRLAAFSLDVPTPVLAAQPVAPGDLVRATPRPYGVEFARTDGTAQREPFFLALADDWRHGLAPRAVEL